MIVLPFSHRGSESANGGTESVGKGAGQGAGLCVSRATECRPTALNIRSNIHCIYSLFCSYNAFRSISVMETQ